MARLLNGPDGPISGKLGNHVAYVINGECFFRMRVKKRTEKRSLKEKKNHSKFAIVQGWMQPIKTFVRIGFKNYGTKTGGYKAAVSFALRDSVEGTYPDLYVNPETVLVSGGELYISPEAEVSYDPAGDRLHFSWNTSRGDNGSDKDQVMMLAYSPEQKEVSASEFGAFRSSGTDSIRLSKGRQEVTYHVYMAFLAYNRSRQSNSIYLGTVTVPAKTA